MDGETAPACDQSNFLRLIGVRGIHDEIVRVGSRWTVGSLCFDFELDGLQYLSLCERTLLSRSERRLWALSGFLLVAGLCVFVSLAVVFDCVQAFFELLDCAAHLRQLGPYGH